MCRRHNPERAQLHRTYTMREIEALYDVCKNTVTTWFRAGLKPIDGKRPFLITGRELRRFMKARMAATKRPSEPGEIYCVACKKTQAPVGKIARFELISDTSGNLIGECPDCARPIYRRVRLANLNRDSGDLVVTLKHR